MAIYISKLMCEHMIKQGGIEYYERLANKKSKHLYDFLDDSLITS
jgi:phosphoserine aminotransferase